MNLPLINNDNVGNSYYGWRTNNFLYAPDSVGFTAQQCVNWINGFFQQTCAVLRTPYEFSLILPVPFETLTLPTSNENYRFRSLSMNPTNTTTGIASPGVYFTTGFELLAIESFLKWVSENNCAVYCVLNNKSMNLFGIKTNGANLNNSQYQFASLGWLDNALYSGSAFPINAYYLFVSSDVARTGAGHPQFPNSNNTELFAFSRPANQFDSIANYPINCQTATPGANATELYLRNRNAPNKAIGYVPSLLKTSLQIPVGQVYINTGIDPSGSNMNTWICVGIWGTERLLMRVWTGGF